MTMHAATTKTAVGRNIITDFWMKPIPQRRFDWEATFDGYDPSDPIGYGATEQDAIADLMQQIEAA